MEAGGAAPRTLGAAAEGRAPPRGWDFGLDAPRGRVTRRLEAGLNGMPVVATPPWPCPLTPLVQPRTEEHLVLTRAPLTKGTEPPGRRRAWGVRIPPPGAARCPLSQNPLFQDAASASPSGFLCLQRKSDA